jgi:Plasmid pRiA4b ORF-3-like protein
MTRKKEEARVKEASIVWRLTIRLTGVMPIVWRTLLVRPNTKLAMLHRYLQAAMGWREYHLYMFTLEGKEYGIPERDRDAGRKVYDARRYTLARLFPKLPSRFVYVYDSGDWWEHTIEIEGEEAAAYRKQYPICIDGAEPCPPEDVGGPPGYRELLLALRDPNHSQHDDLRAWAKSQFYSGRFRAQDATWRMRDVQRGLI